MFSFLSEGAVEGGAVNAKVAGDLGFGYSGSDTLPGLVELLGGQAAASTLFSGSFIGGGVWR